ncbi:uncharacterized protein C10orf107 homolog isoform X3 [Numida meleagris]|uniref:uncharacterized protein C10orf107 homolog isoform X3 n=1 Tax=Numida meleagris TaxID=8996 RepID=UPI000B3E2995|nr:uncharacterized protein C10orf107 homolog isoform X3 [Numida meleagris]
MAPGGLRPEASAAREELRGPPRSLGNGDAEPGSMAATGQEEDQDQDAVGGQRTINHTFLSLSQITALSDQNVEGVQKKLGEFLNFRQLKTSLKEAILLDYYTAGFCWAKEMNFSLMQLSRFMDLLNFLLENLRDKHMTLEDNIKELGKAMAGIGETDSERSDDLDVFSIDQAKAIIDYMNISLFRLYKLYEHLFHNPREERVISNEIYKLYLILQFMFFCCSPLCIFGWNEAKVFWDYVCFETFPNKNNVVGKSSFIPGCFSQPDGVICYFMAQMTS